MPSPRNRNTPEQPTPEQPATPEQPTPAAPTTQEAAQAPQQAAQPPQQPTSPTPTKQAAAQARGDAMADVKEGDRNIVNGLLDERRGYVQRDKKDRVALVDEQLRARGYRTAER